MDMMNNIMSHEGDGLSLSNTKITFQFLKDSLETGFKLSVVVPINNWVQNCVDQTDEKRDPNKLHSSDFSLVPFRPNRRNKRCKKHVN